jgi:hypothetical protein
MKKCMTSMIGLSLMFFALNASAQQPTKDEIVKAGATYTGTLKPAKGGTDWACTVTVKGDGEVLVKWSDSEVTYKGKMGPGGAKAGSPIVMNGTGKDKSEVRFLWKSAKELQVEWWPNSEAKAGQKENKPAHVKGTISKK